MVTKKNKVGELEEKSGRVNLDKLELNKETVKDLTDSEKRQVRGGAKVAGSVAICSDVVSQCVGCGPRI